MPAIEPFQIIAVIITFFGVARSISQFKQRKLSPSFLVFWMLLWTSISVVAFIPGVSYVVSHSLGIDRGIDLLIYLSIIVLFYLVFKMTLKLEAIEHNITRLVREIAIRRK